MSTPAVFKCKYTGIYIQHPHKGNRVGVAHPLVAFVQTSGNPVHNAPVPPAPPPRRYLPLLLHGLARRHPIFLPIFYFVSSFLLI
jgi:hypothetical protein